MKNNRRMFVSIIWILLGVGLIVGDLVTEMDSFWSGFGTGFLAVGVLQLVRWIRYIRNADYREKANTEANDERNHFLTAKAWSWAGYLFVLISAVACIVLRICGQNDLSLMASGAMCLILVLYWVSYFIVRRKY